MFSVTLDEFEDTELSSIGHSPSYFSVSRCCQCSDFFSVKKWWCNLYFWCVWYIWYDMIMYIYIYNIHIVRGIPWKQRMISVFFKSGNWYWRGKTNDLDVNWCSPGPQDAGSWQMKVSLGLLIKHVTIPGVDLCWVGGYLVSMFPLKKVWLLLRFVSTPNRPRGRVPLVRHGVKCLASEAHVFSFLSLGKKTPFFCGGKFSISPREIIHFFPPLFFVGKGCFFLTLSKVSKVFNKKTPKSQRQPSQPQGIELRTPASSDVFVGRFSNATKPQVFIEDLWRSVQEWWVYYWFLDYYGFTIGLLWVY